MRSSKSRRWVGRFVSCNALLGGVLFAQLPAGWCVDARQKSYRNLLDLGEEVSEEAADNAKARFSARNHLGY